VSRIAVVVDGAATALSPAGAGWWDGPSLDAGTDYAFLLDEDEQPVPDPASRWQPEGVHGPSRVYDQDAYTWQDADWPGRALKGGLVYELHIGTFTPEGTFDSAIERLDELVELGVTHVEPLPVNAVNGIWNWGYDGVGWYAVHEPLGGPDGFKRFVDAAHHRGLAVVLDVVYNHLGPSGNYLPRFGPEAGTQYVGRSRQRRGACCSQLHPRQRPHVDARLPRGRPASRRCARLARRLAAAHPG
jgi:maltooligosyltrehalose trehalohydrolase